MPKIVFYTADDPSAQNETYTHLALLLYDGGAPMPIRVTGRTREVVAEAAEKVLADELERAAKSPRNPANQRSEISPRKRRQIPNGSAPDIDEQIAEIRQQQAMAEPAEPDLEDVVAAPSKLAPAEPEFEEEF